MKKILLLIAVFITTINVFSIKTGKNFDRFTISEFTSEGRIMIDIDYFASFGRPVMLHLGTNGWDNIQDIYSENGEFELSFDRDISGIDICFRTDEKWDNNNGNDYHYNTSNYLCKEYIRDKKDLIPVRDYIEESIQSLENLKLMIKNHYEKNPDNLRLALTAEFAIRDGKKILLLINRTDSNTNISDINTRFNLFRDIVENLI